MAAEFHRLAVQEFREARDWYLLILQEDAPGDLFVVAVSHTRRRPGYWQRRV